VLSRYQLCPCVCLSVCHKPVLCRNGWRIELILDIEAILSVYPTLFWKVIRVSPKIRILLSWTLSQTLDFKKFRDRRKCCQLKWTLSVINWRRSSVASLSHWASTFVYNTMGVTQRVARVCLQKQRLVKNVVMANWTRLSYVHCARRPTFVSSAHIGFVRNLLRTTNKLALLSSHEMSFRLSPYYCSSRPNKFCVGLSRQQFSTMQCLTSAVLPTIAQRQGVLL